MVKDVHDRHDRREIRFDFRDGDCRAPSPAAISGVSDQVATSNDAIKLHGGFTNIDLAPSHERR